MTIYEKLSLIQTNLRVPKGQFNNFGQYKYRSCEDIVEAVKPLLGKEKLTLIISDDIIMVGDRYYIKATAKIGDGKDWIETSAFAREDISKKGMDSSQLTGSTSSYARKYALNGLFAIDDTKESDTRDNRSQDESRPKDKEYKLNDKKPASVKQQELLRTLLYQKYGGEFKVPAKYLNAISGLSSKGAHDRIALLKEELENREKNVKQNDNLPTITEDDIPF